MCHLSITRSSVFGIYECHIISQSWVIFCKDPVVVSKPFIKSLTPPGEVETISQRIWNIYTYICIYAYMFVSSTWYIIYPICKTYAHIYIYMWVSCIYCTNINIYIYKYTFVIHIHLKLCTWQSGCLWSLFQDTFCDLFVALLHKWPNLGQLASSSWSGISINLHGCHSYWGFTSKNAGNECIKVMMNYILDLGSAMLNLAEFPNATNIMLEHWCAPIALFCRKLWVI